MKQQRLWIWPRTRVGIVGAMAVVAFIGVTLWMGNFAVPGTVILAAVTGVLWTAIVRHGDASVVLWLMACAGIGWLVLLVIR
ncbi:MAG: hypothetical protein RLY87_2368 [Chloroflexota bacterium]|jgi:hypothetical protein